MKYAVKKIDNDVWTLAYEIVRVGVIRIDNHTRNNVIGYDNNIKKPKFTLDEDDFRLAVGVIIDDVYYTVENPYDVFKPKPDYVK
jgi:hypothetical protein